MTVMMNNRELTREEGRLIGFIEGFEIGFKEVLEKEMAQRWLRARQKLALQLLQDGVEIDFIQEHLNFDDAQVEALRNDKINSE